MKRSLLITLAPLLWLLPACSKQSGTGTTTEPGQPKEVPKLVAAEADNLASDANFALQIRDYARAEQSLARALKLRADVPEWWVTYGSTCKRLGKTGEARAAYKKALNLFTDRFDATKDPQSARQQLFLLVLLGREEESRKLLERFAAKQPDEPFYKELMAEKFIDQLLADDTVKQMRL